MVSFVHDCSDAIPWTPSPRERGFVFAEYIRKPAMICLSLLYNLNERQIAIVSINSDAKALCRFAVLLSCSTADIKIQLDRSFDCVTMNSASTG